MPPKLKVEERTAALTKPFVMERIARVDHFAINVYLCQGFVARHRHVTRDELFYVHDGIMTIDTDTGQITLRKDEFGAVPRGVSHLSGSILRTLVMYFQAESDPERKNGHGRLTFADGSRAAHKGALSSEVARAGLPFRPVPLAQVDEMSLRAVVCEGATPWHRHVDHDELLWSREGELEVGTEHGPTTLEPDELTVVPRNTVHRVVAHRRAVVLSLVHASVSTEAHMGLMGETGLE